MRERSADDRRATACEIAQRREFDELFVSILPALYPRVVSQTRSRDVADEVINDVYVRLATGLAWRTMMTHPNPIGYSLTTATNLIRDRWRRQLRVREALRRFGGELDAHTDGGLDEQESRSLVWSMLRNLNRKEAAAVMLVDVVGHSLCEAGALLGVTRATVHENRRRGLNRLRSRYPGQPQSIAA